MLFLLIINDIAYTIRHSHILLYADDMKLYEEIKAKGNSELLQLHLDKLVNWSTENCLPFNIKKSESIKLEVHLRQRQAVVRHGSLSSTSVDSTMNRATCLRKCHNLSHRLLVDQSEASSRNSPPYAQYGWNMSCLAETEKHSLECGLAR